jgi:hypothetical protein
MTTATASPDSPQLYALLRACKDSPLDDLPRLVLARVLAASPHLNRVALLGTVVLGLTDPAQEEVLAGRFGRDVRGLVFTDRLYRRDN